eukprot:TRINITY_DN11075_c0_g1_i2.p1 TRINITY_DN11075_c0_g1~~TRINITY_DN11075_c0_g1_i2.p1  ORF type:complete len:337 (-),score=82.75 TRINITY_DN11075_c0_g1_i2:731-1741(-)
MFLFFFFNDTATTEIYTLHIVGSVRCVQETVSTQSTWACILKEPHRLHKNEEIIKAIDKIAAYRDPFKNVLTNYRSLEATLERKFNWIKQLYSVALDIIKSSYMKDIEKELIKLNSIDYFLKNSHPEQIKYKIFDRKFNDLVYPSVGDERQKFLDKLLPDSDKINNFIEFISDKIKKIEDSSQQFVKIMLSNYLTEINYYRQDEIERLRKANENQNANSTENQEITKPNLDKFPQCSLQAIMKGHEQIILDIKELADNIVASASDDNTIRIWKTDQQLSLRILRGHTQAVLGICKLSEHNIISYSKDRTIREWEWNTGDQLRQFTWQNLIITQMVK